jgi:hypothetical protein
MFSILSEAEKLGWSVTTGAVKCSPDFVRPITSEPELRQQLPVELHRPVKIFYSQVNVIKSAAFHARDLRLGCEIIKSRSPSVPTGLVRSFFVIGGVAVI